MHGHGCLTKYGMSQHLVLVGRLAQQGVGDGSGRVGEARQVWSSGERVDKRVGPRTWGTHKTFTTTFAVSALSSQRTGE